MDEWHDDDAFWTIMAPFLFHEERWLGTQTEIDLILELTGAGSDIAVLDLGCGPGRHALELARRGFMVTGVDRTAVYLEQARRKAGHEGLAVEFVQADMRDFRRPDAFDLALSLFTTFGYFEEAADNELVLANVHASLRAGGTLLIDMTGKEVLARKFQPRDWVEQDGVFLLEERRVIDDWRRVENTWTVFDGEERRAFTFRHWLYAASELDAMLRAAGFGAVALYGDLGGRPYDHEAGRLVAVARK
jgi:SAM-dependent methyltransferase